MLITLELLEKYGADSEQIKLLETKYPDGIELEKLMMDPDFTINMLHQAHRFFKFNPKELELYNQICNIKNSLGYSSSTNVVDSKSIGASEQITRSFFIQNSVHVSDSEFVFGSKDIARSKEIFNCFKVDDSNTVINSKYISDSDNILNSNNVEWSSYVTASKEVTDSSLIYNSKNVKNCKIGGFLTNCDHCLFCIGLKDKDYYVFNQPVEKITYEEIAYQLEIILLNETHSFIDVDPQIYTPTGRYKYSNAPDAVLSGLSPQFYGRIGKMPLYDENVFLQLFLTEANLKNE